MFIVFVSSSAAIVSGDLNEEHIRSHASSLVAHTHGIWEKFGALAPRLYPPAGAAQHLRESWRKVPVLHAHFKGRDPRRRTEAGLEEGWGEPDVLPLLVFITSDAICEAASRKHQESHNCVKSQLLFIFPSLTKTQAESFEQKGTARLFFFLMTILKVCASLDIYFFSFLLGTLAHEFLILELGSTG